MIPRWLLLAVGMVCLLVLAPAAAVSQGGTEIACGSAVIDGNVGADEWADATRLPMRGYSYLAVEHETPDGIPQARGATLAGQSSPAQDEWETEGWLYLKNDERYLYVGATMDLGKEDPDWWTAYLQVFFTDEPCGRPRAWVDDKWAALECEDTWGGEGSFWAEEAQYGATHETWDPAFAPGTEAEKWCIEHWERAHGVVARAGRHTAHYEMRIDLQASELNCADPGDCLRFFVQQHDMICPVDDAACPGPLIAGWVSWPAFLAPYDYDWESPDVFGTICLNPCQAEFVPEPGTALLLASGLLILAGYAGLRWRARA